MLSDGRRRSIVAFLASEDGPVSRRELIARLATDESDRGRFATRLHHVHVPKLADAGLLVHDPDEDTLRCGANARQALGVLTAAPGEPGSNA